MYLQSMGMSMAMYANITNHTDSKGRRQIHYGSDNQYRKIHQKFTGMYQPLSNMCESIITDMYHYKMSNIEQKRVSEIYKKTTQNLLGMACH